MKIASSRTARQQRIIEILSQQSIRSQPELLDILARDGIEVTQATLSRDLVEIGAEKVRVGKQLVYAVPGEGGDRTVRPAPDAQEVSQRLQQRVQELLGSPRERCRPARDRAGNQNRRSTRSPSSTPRRRRSGR